MRVKVRVRVRVKVRVRLKIRVRVRVRVSVDEPCALEDLVEAGTLGYLRLEHRLQLGVGVGGRVRVRG